MREKEEMREKIFCKNEGRMTERKRAKQSKKKESTMNKLQLNNTF